MFNNRLINELRLEIDELKNNNSRLVKQLDSKALEINHLTDKIHELTRKMYYDHLNCSIIIDWSSINVVAVRRINYSVTKLTYVKPDGDYSWIDIECNEDMHEALCDEYTEYLDSKS